MKVLEENTETQREKNSISITHEELDELFAIVEDMELPSLGYYPTVEEIEIMKANIPKYYTFIIWVLSNPNEPETREERESEKELNRLIMKYTRFKDKTITSKSEKSQRC